MATAAEKKALFESLLPEMLARMPQKQEKARMFLQRAIDRGLTQDDVDWNRKLGRPVHWKETVDPKAEKARRDEWTILHPEAQP